MRLSVGYCVKEEVSQKKNLDSTSEVLCRSTETYSCSGNVKKFERFIRSRVVSHNPLGWKDHSVAEIECIDACKEIGRLLPDTMADSDFALKIKTVLPFEDGLLPDHEAALIALRIFNDRLGKTAHGTSKCYTDGSVDENIRTVSLLFRVFLDESEYLQRDAD